ncbi:MAG: L-threonylcarbamoyladenylate synthase [Gammaproteobacteria bacterium]
MLTEAVERAAQIVRAGGVIAYPTEAVFGLGCDPLNQAAVERLLDLKGRPRDKGMILIAAAFDQLETLLEPLTRAQRQRINRTWPGPVTWLIPATRAVPILLRGNHETLAVRVTAHPVAAELCRRAGRALVSTSANITGAPAAKSADAVQQIFGSQIDFVLDGPVGERERPTEIRDAISGKVVRAG